MLLALFLLQPNGPCLSPRNRGEDDERHSRSNVRAERCPVARPEPRGRSCSRQWVWLSRGLVALCQWRLEHILHHSDPLDLPLEKFLKEQIAAEEESADSLD